MRIPEPTYEEFVEALTRKFGVLVRDVPVAPFHQPNRAVVLERAIGDVTTSCYFEISAGKRMMASEVRSTCARLAINPLDFGVRPTGGN